MEIATPAGRVWAALGRSTNSTDAECLGFRPGFPYTQRTVDRTPAVVDFFTIPEAAEAGTGT